MNGQKKSEKEGFYCFQIGDIVTRDPRIPKDCWWYGEVQVNGMTRDQLWGIQNEETRRTDQLDGLLLLARPGWPYRVKDKVSFLYGNGKKGKGRIVMLNPDPNLKYLIELEEGESDRLVAGAELGNDPWIPLLRRNRFFKNCLFLNEEDIIRGWD